MTDSNAFNEIERREFTARGFSVSDDATTAHVEGVAVSAVRHGYHHFLFTITLPDGSTVSGFMPKSRIIGDVASSHDLEKTVR